MTKHELTDAMINQTTVYFMGTTRCLIQHMLVDGFTTTLSDNIYYYCKELDKFYQEKQTAWTDIETAFCGVPFAKEDAPKLQNLQKVLDKYKDELQGIEKK